MKAKEYLEAIGIEDQEQELHRMFYEQMYDDDVDCFESVFLSNMIRMKFAGEI